MSWAIGYDEKWKRDIGYGVPALCDHPNCIRHIDRGLSYVCGGEPYGGDDGCGLYFCHTHLVNATHCIQCSRGAPAFAPKPDLDEWLRHKLVDPSWKTWRKECPEEATAAQAQLDRPTEVICVRSARDVRRAMAMDRYVYVGREPGSIGAWGNRYSHLASSVPGVVMVKTRKEAVEQHRKEVLDDEELVKRIRSELKGKVLGCWCGAREDRMCHAYTLADVADGRIV